MDQLERIPPNTPWDLPRLPAPGVAPSPIAGVSLIEYQAARDQAASWHAAQAQAARWRAARTHAGMWAPPTAQQLPYQPSREHRRRAALAAAVAVAGLIGAAVAVVLI